MGRRTVEEEAEIRKAILDYLDDKGDKDSYRKIAKEIERRIHLKPSTATVGNVVNEWRQQKGGDG